jgi:hypothetical protein
MAHSTEQVKRRRRYTRAVIAFVTAAVLAGIAAIISNAVQSTPKTVKRVISGNHSVKPITFTVKLDPSHCQQFLFQKDLSALGPPPANRFDLANWARSQGGIAATDYGTLGSLLKVLVTIRGTASTPVTVTGLTFEVTKRVVGGLSGTVVEEDCGSETYARYAEVDLDKDPPEIVASSDKTVGWDSSALAVTPIRFPYKVTDTDSESILLLAHTHDYVEWVGHLSWTDGKNQGTELISMQGGKPIQITHIKKAMGNYLPSSAGWQKIG